MSEEIKQYKTSNIKTTFNMVRDDVHKNAVNHGWHDTPREFGTIMMLCVCELAEAQEEHRNHREPTEIYFNDGSEKPEGVPVEIADCIIRLLDYCGKENIDIGEAIMMKHNYNLTRPYRHGNKAC